MLTIRWTEDCETGVALIDEQHKHLIDVMNTLAKAIDQKKTTETTDVVLVEIADELNQYIDEHFRDEEALYLEHGIEIVDHQTLHKDFVNRLKHSRNALANGDDILKLLEVYRELLDWFMNHIKDADKNLWKTKK